MKDKRAGGGKKIMFIVKLPLECSCLQLPHRARGGAGSALFSLVTVTGPEGTA